MAQSGRSPLWEPPTWLEQADAEHLEFAVMSGAHVA
jgi:hypothetical protein